MSSPIAKIEKSRVDAALIGVHRKVSHGRRIEQLARLIGDAIERTLPPRPPCHPLQLMDLGCGDMTLTDALAPRFPGAEFRCLDIHECPTGLARTDDRWARYQQFDGEHLPFEDGRFDVAYLSDVLHHVPEESRPLLLREAARVASRVVIKDHFEYGWWSRQTLRAMDFVGNFAYGVSVPRRYFDQRSFADLCSTSNVQMVHMHAGIQLYAHLPVARAVLSPRWQFLAVVERQAR